jgi:para-nitrobenzyl esterase
VLALLASPAADGLFRRRSRRARAAADRRPRAAGRGGARVPAQARRERRRGQGAAAAATAQRRRQLQLKSAAATPTLAYGLTYGVDLLPTHPVDAAREGHAGAGAADHRHQQPRGVDVRVDQAADAAHDHRVDQTPTWSRGARRKDRVLAAYPDYPRRRALIAFGSDVMFGGPAWAFADTYSAIAPTHVYRFDHFGWSLRILGLGATHGSEIVHIQHSYASFIGRKLHPLGRRLQPPVGRRMQRRWLDFAARAGTQAKSDWSSGHDWPIYDTRPLHPHHPVGPRHGGRGPRRRTPQGLGRPVLGRSRVALVA